MWTASKIFQSLTLSVFRFLSSLIIDHQVRTLLAHGTLVVNLIYIVWCCVGVLLQEARYVYRWIRKLDVSVSDLSFCSPITTNHQAPEFEEAAQELKGKVRFTKLDTDKDEAMAARLNIMGLPTLLFLDKFEGDDEAGGAAKAVLKGRIEGALRKQNILDLCEHYFFDGPEPKLF